MMGQVSVTFNVPVEGWVECTCECAWESGRSVSGKRVKMALMDHLQEGHGVTTNPDRIRLPDGAPE